MSDNRSNTKASQQISEVSLHLSRLEKLIKAVETADSYPLKLVYAGASGVASGYRDLFPMDLLEMDEELTALVREQVAKEIVSVTKSLAGQGITIDLEALGIDYE